MSTQSEILKALIDKRNVLAVADGLDTALVMQVIDGVPVTKARCTAALAQELVRGGLVILRQSGKMEQYGLSDRGREELQRQTSEPRRAAPARDLRVGVGGDSPLDMLRRRKDKTGQPYLSAAEVEVAHIAELGFTAAGFPPSLGMTGEEFVARGAEGCVDSAMGHRFIETMRELGDGLSDIVLRVICLREGLEAVEKRLGWSARSGKVVLKIALMRLALKRQGDKT